MEINEKELTIIKEIANNHLPNQRIIAKNTGLSLGLVNLIIKRLINKGYIKTKNLNKKKIQYILTTRGLAEKAKKSYYFTLKTIEQFKLTNKKIQDLISDYYQKGIRKFIILPDNELATLVELAIKTSNLPELKYTKVSNLNQSDLNSPAGEGTAVFITDQMKNNLKNDKNCIEIISYLANSGIYF